jgi:uncharacterized membrane protein
MTLEKTYTHFGRELGQVFCRFPLSVLCIFAPQLLRLFDIYNPDISLAAVSLYFLLAGIVLAGEYAEFTKAATQLVACVIASLAVVWNFYSGTRWLSDGYVICGCIGFACVAPYFGKSMGISGLFRIHYAFWGYVGRLVPCILVLYLMGAACLFFAESMSNVRITRTHIASLHGIILFTILPLLLLAGIPRPIAVSR